MGTDGCLYLPSLYGMASGIGTVCCLGKVEISSGWFFSGTNLGSYFRIFGGTV